MRLDGDEIELALDEPVSAITPGQSLVLYDGERVLGGGLIERGGERGRVAGARCVRGSSDVSGASVISLLTIATADPLADARG